MTIGERIRFFREEFHIKQGDMANKIGIKQGSLSDIERGKVVDVTDRVIKDICREFGANEIWIRTGEGDMLSLYNDFEEFLLSHLGTLDEMDKKIITEYIKLNSEHREVMKSFIRKMIE